MNEYFLYSYLEAIELRYYDYKKENELDKNDFDTGKVKAFNNAITIMKKFLSERCLLDMYESDENPIFECGKNIKININQQLIVDILKKYIVHIQQLYNDLIDKKDMLSNGERFGYYDVLDMLEIDIKCNAYKDLKGFNISIPISLDKKVKISEIK